MSWTVLLCRSRRVARSRHAADVRARVLHAPLLSAHVCPYPVQALVTSIPSDSHSVRSARYSSPFEYKCSHTVAVSQKPSNPAREPWHLLANHFLMKLRAIFGGLIVPGPRVCLDRYGVALSPSAVAFNPPHRLLYLGYPCVDAELARTARVSFRVDRGPA
jgi:hypothetical protein